MLVIADSSALIALSICNCLELLDKLFDVVKVPQSVFDEIVRQGKPEAETLRSYLSGKIATLDVTSVVISAGSLGRGELDAMALCKQLGADYLLIDDKRARKIAQLNGIKIMGSLGVLLLAKQQGLLGSIKPAIDKLQNSDIHLSDRLVKKSLLLAGEAQ